MKSILMRKTVSESKTELIQFHHLPTGVLQDLVLILMFTKPLGSVIKSNGFSYHGYADDTTPVLC